MPDDGISPFNQLALPIDVDIHSEEQVAQRKEEAAKFAKEIMDKTNEMADQYDWRADLVEDIKREEEELKRANE